MTGSMKMMQTRCKRATWTETIGLTGELTGEFGGVVLAISPPAWRPRADPADAMHDRGRHGPIGDPPPVLLAVRWGPCPAGRRRPGVHRDGGTRQRERHGQGEAQLTSPMCRSTRSPPTWATAVPRTDGARWNLPRRPRPHSGDAVDSVRDPQDMPMQQRDLVIRAQGGDADAFGFLVAGRVGHLAAVARLILALTIRPMTPSRTRSSRPGRGFAGFAIQAVSTRGPTGCSCAPAIGRLHGGDHGP